MLAPPSSIAVDLSQLPAPAALPLDYEQLLAERFAELKVRWPEFDATVESDPVTKLLEVEAYRELLARGSINDAVRSVFLAYAGGAALDHLAANAGLQRLVLAPATDFVPAVMESDENLRARIQIAPEGLAATGLTAGGYRGLALRTAPEVKHVGLVKRDGGHIDVILLGRDGDGAVPAPIVDRVYRAFQRDDATQLTDIIAVRAAEVVPYAVEITLAIRPGPDPAPIRMAAEQAVRAYAERRHKVGHVVYAQMIASAASVGGVENARIDIGDIDPGPAGAAYLAELNIGIEAAP